MKIKRFGALLCSLLAVLGLNSCAKKTSNLNLLVWEGYADPSFIRGFEEQCKCKVSASYMGSSDELVAKLRGGSASNYDVISPSSDVATMLAVTGLTTPLDLSKIPSYSQLSPKLTSLPLVHVSDKVYGVPFMWGPNPVIYDTTAFPQPPDTWNVLWDPKYRGKISVWDDLSTVYMAAQILGYDKPDPGQLYNMSDEQLGEVKKKLLELKPNVRKMWSTGGELTNLFLNHEVIAAMGWPLNTAELKKRNYPVGETIPKENTTGWIDHLMITSASENKDVAYQFLEYMVQARTQKQVTDVTRYTPANPQAGRFMTAEQRQILHMDDVDNYQRRIYFWQDVPRRAKYNEIWNEVKAAQ
jgi:putative spermidine/putrescine transport system substrate-binding protein/spermidine/putrescine transport system substrate-binding protein